MAIPGWLWAPGAFIFSVLFGLAASSILLLALHEPIFQTYEAIFEGAVGSWTALQSSLVYAEPIAFTGMAAAVAFRARVWNIGAEGQMVMGAIGAVLSLCTCRCRIRSCWPRSSLVGWSAGQYGDSSRRL